MANLSEQKREKMLQILDALKAQHKDEETIIAINEIKNEINSKKYGLVWEQHEENVDIQMKTHVPVFTEVKEKEIKANPSDEKFNFILEGDNLHSLKLLEKTHKGRVDTIYIDPPYNTGNNNIRDFIYEDRNVDETDGFRHSKWLSFMSERLKIARVLLKDSGVIFISIDDNEMAQLKMLCDELFGANNFVGIILWKKKTNGNNMGWLPPVHDYVLCYSRNIDKIYDLGYELSEEDINKKYSNPDNDPRGPWTTTDLSANHVGPTFPITNPQTGQVFYPPEGRYWVFNEKEVQKRIEDGRIIFGKTGTSRPVQRVFAKDRKLSKRKAESWWDKNGMNADATEELKQVFGKAKVFTHPKPTRLIKDIIKISCNKCDSLVLDFFAGSGTTGQAVLELNKEDGGNRQFILCTNNESQICEKITYPRVKTIITGKRDDGSGYSEGIPSNLKYFRTDFVSKASEEEFYSVEEQLSNHIKEMIELENGISIDNEKYIMILTDEEADELEKTPERIKKCERIYVSGEVLLTQKQENLFNDKDIITIPQYYFEDELMEVGEL